MILNVDMTLYQTIPSASDHSAAMESGVEIHFDDGDRYYNVAVQHDGTSLSADSEDDSAIRQLIEYFETKGHSLDESHEQAWEVVREATRRMYRVCKKGGLTPDGLERFEAV